MFCGKSKLITLIFCCPAVQSLESPRRFGCCCCCCCGVVAVAIAESCAQGARSCHCAVLFVSLSFSLFPLFFLSVSLPLRLHVGPLRPCLRRELLQPLSWLLALLDASSIRIHHDLFHHATCLFDTSVSWYIESFFSLSPFPSNVFLLRSSSLLPNASLSLLSSRSSRHTLSSWFLPSSRSSARAHLALSRSSRHIFSFSHSSLRLLSSYNSRSLCLSLSSLRLLSSYTSRSLFAFSLSSLRLLSSHSSPMLFSTRVSSPHPLFRSPPFAVLSNLLLFSSLSPLSSPIFFSSLSSSSSSSFSSLLLIFLE